MERIMRSILNRGKSLVFLLFSVLIRCVTCVNDRRIVCYSFGFKQYSCSPRYIAEYLNSNHCGEFEIYWIQQKNLDTLKIPKGIHLVRPYTLFYFILINTAKIVITNTRNDLLSTSYIKRKKQLYIQTWHGLIPLKKIEADVAGLLSKEYVLNAKLDSKMCDLILSGAQYSTENIKSSFWYNGEILQYGLPRNEILFSLSNGTREKVQKLYNLPKCASILLYAPTFRKNYAIEPYTINWPLIINELNLKFGGEYYVLLRLHPNFYNHEFSENNLVIHKNVIDVTSYPDMQELLSISDILVTDYSSSMFDAALVRKPCFLYATDISKYDRGFYFDLNELPFPIAESEEELIENIRDFQTCKYIANIERFNLSVGMVENPIEANFELYKWIKSRLESK